MPFTFSHPAIVLPLSRLPKQWVSMTGLIIGSIVPDFEYFLRMKVESIYSHTWSGLFWFDLPLGLLIMWLYQATVKNALIDHLPENVNRRLSKYKDVDRRYSIPYLFIVVCSISAGGASHILWDSFTHAGGYFVIVAPFLSYEVTAGQYHLPVYKLLQHASSAAGAIVIAVAVYTLPMGACTKSNNIIGYCAIVALVMAAVLAIRFAAGMPIGQYGAVIVTGISGILLGLLAASLIYSRRTGAGK